MKKIKSYGKNTKMSETKNETKKDKGKAMSVQSLVDEHKKELGDGLYKELCDALMQEYKTESTIGLYKIRYIKPSIVPTGNSGCLFVHQEPTTSIVEISHMYAERMQKNIEEDGYCVMDMSDIRENGGRPDMFSYLFMVEGDDEDECECCSESKPRMENINYHYHACVLSIKKV